MSSVIKNPFKRGMILMWSGTIATIPGGWALCNGLNGTPDLRNKFVICADADSGGAAKTTVTGAATQSGGAATINLQHNHGGATGNPSAGPTNVDGSSSPVTPYPHTHSISNDLSTTQSVLNPYYALAYIMKK